MPAVELSTLLPLDIQKFHYVLVCKQVHHQPEHCYTRPSNISLSLSLSLLHTLSLSFSYKSDACLAKLHFLRWNNHRSEMQLTQWKKIEFGILLVASSCTVNQSKNQTIIFCFRLRPDDHTEIVHDREWEPDLISDSDLSQSRSLYSNRPFAQWRRMVKLKTLSDNNYAMVWHILLETQQANDCVLAGNPMYKWKEKSLKVSEKANYIVDFGLAVVSWERERETVEGMLLPRARSICMCNIRLNWSWSNTQDLIGKRPICKASAHFRCTHIR